MKRIIASIFSALLCLVVQAATYTVEQVPNVHLADSAAYVSDPDGLLDAAAVDQINAAMRSIRRTTTAEPAVVIVGDIDGGDIDTFATELFEKWGLGKSDLDNGLLILVVKDLRRAAIRPGYGLEGVLPDIVCAEILKHKMFPMFKQGRYGDGLVAASQAVEQILTDPDVAAEIRSGQADADFRGTRGDGGGTDAFTIYFYIAAVMALLMLAILVVQLISVRRYDRHSRYVALNKLKPIYLALTFLGLGMPLVASVPLLLVLYRLRNAPHKCPRCGTAMKKVDEVHDNEYLNPAQDLEERIGSVDYDVWLCPKCGETDIEQYVNSSSGYRECSFCHAHAAKLERSRILRKPTTASKGEGLHEYRCMHCGHMTYEPFDIPMVVAPPVIISGGRGGGGFGGGGFGGGFGGGHTGGGGASGGW